MTGAAETVLKCLAVIRNLVLMASDTNQTTTKKIPGGAFLTIDPQYPLKVPLSALCHVPGEKSSTMILTRSSVDVPLSRPKLSSLYLSIDTS